MLSKVLRASLKRNWRRGNYRKEVNTKVDVQVQLNTRAPDFNPLVQAVDKVAKQMVEAMTKLPASITEGIKGSQARSLQKSFLEYAAVVSIVSTVGYEAHHFYKYIQQPRMVAYTLKSGTKFSTPPHFIERKNEALESALTANKTNLKYFFITGQKFTGKSTMVADMMYKLNKEGAVIVSLNGSTDADIVLSLAETLQLARDYLTVSPRFGLRTQSQLHEILAVVEKGLNLYRNQTGKTPLLIIDDSDKLSVMSNTEAFKFLLEKAKYWSRTGVCKVGFIVSDGRAPIDFWDKIPIGEMEPIWINPVSDSDMKNYVQEFNKEHPHTVGGQPSLDMVDTIIGGNFNWAQASKKSLDEILTTTKNKINRRWKNSNNKRVLTLVSKKPDIILSDITEENADFDEVVKILIRDEVLAMDLATSRILFKNRAVETAVKNKLMGKE